MWWTILLVATLVVVLLVLLGFGVWAYRAANSNARIATPTARADTFTRPTSMPSIIW